MASVFHQNPRFRSDGGKSLKFKPPPAQAGTEPTPILLPNLPELETILGNRLKTSNSWKLVKFVSDPGHYSRQPKLLPQPYPPRVRGLNSPPIFLGLKKEKP